LTNRLIRFRKAENFLRPNLTFKYRRPETIEPSKTKLMNKLLRELDSRLKSKTGKFNSFKTVDHR